MVKNTPVKNTGFWENHFNIVSGFFSGAESSLSNNLTLGVTGIFDQGAQPWHNDIAYSLGQVSGDILGMIFGAATAVGGIASQGVGLAATPTGVLTAPGITLTAGGTIAAGYGTGVASRSLYNFSNSADNLSGAIRNSGNKGKGEYDPMPNHSTIKDNKLPTQGKPNSSIDRVDDKGNVIQRRYYDENGRSIRDVDFTNHGNPKQHPNGSHEHIWDWSNPNKPIRK